MNTEWKEYTGSYEQITEMRRCRNGYKVRTDNNYVDGLIFHDSPSDLIGIEITHYLLCNPHPLADMICQQAGTGQPVWIRVTRINDWGRYIKGKYYEPGIEIVEYQDPTNNPNWNISGAEYSFTPFEEEV